MCRPTQDGSKGMRRSGSLGFLLPVGILLVTLSAHGQMETAQPPSGFTVEVLDAMPRLPGNLGALPAPPEPATNPTTSAKIELGRALFFDKHLSRDNSISCAVCHDPAKAYSDGRKRAIGIGKRPLPRRSPTLLNVAYNTRQFWDGRASTLEQQVAGPIFSANEMGMDPSILMERVRSVPEYRRGFRQAFGREINFEDIKKAIAAFERTLVTPDSAFDRYMQGEKQSLTTEQKRGLILFVGKARCSACHNGPNFTDNKFHSLGVLPGERYGDDAGRYAVTRKSEDRHAFKTPTLRNVALQAGYMHNGGLATLSDVIDFYDKGGGQGPKSKLLFQLGLTPFEKQDLLAFLQALNGRMPPLDRRLD